MKFTRVMRRAAEEGWSTVTPNYCSKYSEEENAALLLQAEMERIADARSARIVDIVGTFVLTPMIVAVILWFIY